MTLIIAGHTLEQVNIEGFKSTHGHGVFFAADSNITQNGAVVVSGFKKVYEMPIRVNGVNLLGNWFNGYHGFIYEGSCAVAFAGSTLVSQHIMNSIRNHLGELKPTYRDGMYQLAMLCETHKFIGQHCDGDMFKRSDYGHNYLLTASFIAGVVQHAIQSCSAYMGTGRAPATTPQQLLQNSGECACGTSTFCTGPRGGAYCLTPSGKKSYVRH